MLSDERLAEIRERRRGITPLPWLLLPEHCGPDGQGIFQAESLGPICEVGDPYPRGDNHPQENMRFFFHAPTDIDDLLAEIERLRALLAPPPPLVTTYFVDAGGETREAAVTSVPFACGDTGDGEAPDGTPGCTACQRTVYQGHAPNCPRLRSDEVAR